MGIEKEKQLIEMSPLIDKNENKIKTDTGTDTETDTKSRLASEPLDSGAFSAESGKTPNGLKVKKISAGGNFSLIIDLENDLYIFGVINNQPFKTPTLIELTDKSTTTKSFLTDNDNIKNFIVKIKDISAGQSHFLIIDENNYVWSMGKNTNGQLGLGNRIDKKNPTKIPIIKNDKNIGFFQAKKIFATQASSYLIDMNDDIWGCGYHYETVITNFFVPIFRKGKNISHGVVNIPKKEIPPLIIDLNDQIWVRNTNDPLALGIKFYPLPNIKAKDISSSGESVMILGYMDI